MCCTLVSSVSRVYLFISHKLSIKFVIITSWFSSLTMTEIMTTVATKFCLEGEENQKDFDRRRTVSDFLN